VTNETLSRRLRALVALVGASCAAWAVAQPATPGTALTYPQKVVRYIVPSSAGSGADVVARIVASGLTPVFNQQVIVENRAGAGGNIGAEVAAKAPADGYTLLQITLTQALNASLYRKLNYDVLRDFVPVSQLVVTPSMVVVHPTLPVKSIPELVKLAKARPGEINYASAGTGTPTFLAAELFKGTAGVNLTHVPYKGGGEAQTSIVSGETSVYFASIGTVLPFVKQGKVRPLAVTSEKRLPFLPDYPTVAETGYPEYRAGNWYGVMVPAKTPVEIVTALHAALKTAVANPAVAGRLVELGFVVIGDRPDEFGAHIRAEIAALAKIVKQLNLSAD